MTFSLLLDIIEETYNYDQTDRAEQLYYMCFDEEAHLLSFKDVKSNLEDWIDECLDCWEITNKTFVKSYKQEILGDDTKFMTLIEHIYYWCQPEGQPETDCGFIQQKRTKKNY